MKKNLIILIIGSLISFAIACLIFGIQDTCIVIEFVAIALVVIGILKIMIDSVAQMVSNRK
jgi:hypothetical protein